MAWTDTLILVLAGLYKALYYIVFAIAFPIVKLGYVIIHVLSPFWSIAHFLLLPFVHLAKVLLGVVTFPFRLHVLDRVETIYIYLGVAGLIGILAGGILHVCFNVLSTTLNINSATPKRTQKQGRTAAVYRAERHKKKADNPDAPPTKKVMMRGGWGASHRHPGLLSQTIVEEEDSDF